MAFMTFEEFKKLQAKNREIEKNKLAALQNSSIKSDAYKMDNLRYGAMDDSYIDSMAEAHDNSQDAVRWKLLADQAMKDDSLYTTNEGDAYRQKELLAVRARKKKIIQEIDELKKELQQRTQLQAYEDRYKDSPMWKLAKKQYIDTGDLSPIESFVTRENALEESMKTRDFTARENELSRQNTLELNKAQKAEQLEYNLDDAQEKVELAQNKLKSAKALRIPTDIRDAQISFNAAVKRLNKIREKMGMGASEYELEDYEESGKNESGNLTVEELLNKIPENSIYATIDSKNAAIEEIKNHPAYTLQKDEKLIKALSNIEKTKTREEIRSQENKDLEAAKKLWANLSKLDKEAYQDGDITYDKNNPDHKLLDKFKATFGIKWNGGK